MTALIYSVVILHGAQVNAEKPKAENARVKALFDSMHAGKYEGVTFPKLELADVPALLERADSTKRLASFPSNPISSHFNKECSEGTMALWLVEGIRKGGKFASLNPRGAKDGVKEADALQKEMAKAYRAWWDKAKSLPAAEATAIDPLKDTGISWR